jgi:hypothetical protein
LQGRGCGFDSHHLHDETSIGEVETSRWLKTPFVDSTHRKGVVCRTRQADWRNSVSALPSEGRGTGSNPVSATQTTQRPAKLFRSLQESGLKVLRWSHSWSGSPSWTKATDCDSVNHGFESRTTPAVELMVLSPLIYPCRPKSLFLSKID